jgi:hypothetical protein
LIQFNSISFPTTFCWLCCRWVIGWKNTSSILFWKENSFCFESFYTSGTL